MCEAPEGEDGGEIDPPQTTGGNLAERMENGNETLEIVRSALVVDDRVQRTRAIATAASPDPTASPGKNTGGLKGVYRSDGGI